MIEWCFYCGKDADVLNTDCDSHGVVCLSDPPILTSHEQRGRAVCQEAAQRKGITLHQFMQTTTAWKVFWIGVWDGFTWGPIRRWLRRIFL